MKKTEDTIHEQLQKVMQDFIAESSPGRRLPSENALCNKYKVARMTVGKVLNQLESEGKITRRRGSGSFVASRPIFTFCLPCADFFSYNDISSYCVRLQMKGAIRAAHELNIGFETVVVSPTNSQTDINYSALSHINRASRLLVTPWFCDLFEWLYKKQCQVCLLHGQNIFYGYRQYTRNWLKLERNRNGALRKIIHQFQQRGYRRIALVSPFVLSEKNHCLTLSYQEEMRSSEAPELILEVPCSDTLTFGILGDFYRRHQFDSLIFSGSFGKNSHGSLNRNLGIPEHIPIFGIDCVPELYPLVDTIPYCINNYEQIGYDAVTMLANEQNQGVTKVYDYEFFE